MRRTRREKKIIRKIRRIPERGGLQSSLVTLAVILAAVAAIWWVVSRYLSGPTVSTPPGPSHLPAPGAFQGDPAEATEKLLKALNEKLATLDLLKLLNKDVAAFPTTFHGKVFSTYLEEFRLPLSLNPRLLEASFAEAANASGAKVAYEKGTFEFRFTPEWVAVQISFSPVGHPRVCLIIDDGGYHRGEVLEHLYGFKVPVTVAIIPDVEFSESLAEEFPRHGVEVMCHMPMEGHEKGMVGGNYKEILKKGMAGPQVKSDVEKALSGLPHCRGLNNHMGSVATTDPELIWEVCQVLKSRDMFIIDSRTTAQSVVEPVAQKAGLPVAHRDVFLDNVEQSEAIRKQLSQLVSRAKRKGLAVGIGHFKTLTLKTLEEAIPALKEQGIQFVYASEVVK